MLTFFSTMFDFKIKPCPVFFWLQCFWKTDRNASFYGTILRSYTRSKTTERWCRICLKKSQVWVFLMFFICWLYQKLKFERVMIVQTHVHEENRGFFLFFQKSFFIMGMGLNNHNSFKFETFGTTSRWKNF